MAWSLAMFIALPAGPLGGRTGDSSAPLDSTAWVGGSSFISPGGGGAALPLWWTGRAGEGAAGGSGFGLGPCRRSVSMTRATGGAAGGAGSGLGGGSGGVSSRGRDRSAAGWSGSGAGGCAGGAWAGAASVGTDGGAGLAPFLVTFFVIALGMVKMDSRISDTAGHPPHCGPNGYKYNLDTLNMATDTLPSIPAHVLSPCGPCQDS